MKLNDGERQKAEVCLKSLDHLTSSNISSMLKQPDINIWIYLSTVQQENTRENIAYLRDKGFILVTWVQSMEWGGTYLNIASTSKLNELYQ
ncbi:hypothetical protein ATL39_0151 [Sinobaca qinghaiensis]|uniref:Uncharacterized protein n=1 Tax=Sinobaca qinghaiensis TaxID=342944 RepID=A0A419V798_9BACL|nr:hypothetical protein [Sinobaca qinghaiensis]RKD75941.1 hypothetical protein ATL39_0151 [Sinobaca qinghaiensis]